MATNEELAQRVQSGERDLIPELWDGVRRYVQQVAFRWWRAWRGNRPGLEVDDLIQCGYIAMCESVGDYDPDRGAFLTWLRLPLLTAFCVEVGCRTPAQLKRPENNAVSLDAPAGSDTEDLSIGDMIEDPAALQAFESTEDQIYLEQIKTVVHAAVDALPDRQRDVVRLRYYEGLTLKETGQRIGIALEGVRQNERKAFIAMQRNPAIREIHHGDRNLYRGTSLGSWRRTGCSVQELELLWKESCVGSHSQVSGKFMGKGVY